MQVLGAGGSSSATARAANVQHAPHTQPSGTLPHPLVGLQEPGALLGGHGKVKAREHRVPRDQHEVLQLRRRKAAAAAAAAACWRGSRCLLLLGVVAQCRAWCCACCCCVRRGSAAGAAGAAAAACRCCRCCRERPLCCCRSHGAPGGATCRHKLCVRQQRAAVQRRRHHAGVLVAARAGAPEWGMVGARNRQLQHGS
jgi:hypothetical protein